MLACLAGIALQGYHGHLHPAALLPEQLTLGFDNVTLVCRASADVDRAEQVKHAWGCWFRHDNMYWYGAVMSKQSSRMHTMTSLCPPARRGLRLCSPSARWRPVHWPGRVDCSVNHGGPTVDHGRNLGPALCAPWTVWEARAPPAAAGWPIPQRHCLPHCVSLTFSECCTFGNKFANLCCNYCAPSKSLRRDLCGACPGTCYVCLVLACQCFAVYSDVQDPKWPAEPCGCAGGGAQGAVGTGNGAAARAGGSSWPRSFTGNPACSRRRRCSCCMRARRASDGPRTEPRARRR